MSRTFLRASELPACSRRSRKMDWTKTEVLRETETPHLNICANQLCGRVEARPNSFKRRCHKCGRQRRRREVYCSKGCMRAHIKKHHELHHEEDRHTTHRDREMDHCWLWKIVMIFFESFDEDIILGGRLGRV